MQENNREKSPIKVRILQYLELKGISRYAFYKDTGTTNGILTQNNGISEENLLRFLSHYDDVNPIWLLTGEGEMLKTVTPQQPAAELPKKNEREELTYIYFKELQKMHDLLQAQQETITEQQQTIREMVGTINILAKRGDAGTATDVVSRAASE